MACSSSGPAPAKAGVDVLVLVVGEVTRRDLGEPPEDAAAEAGDVFARRRLGGHEGEVPRRVGYEQSIWRDVVKMDVSVQGAAEALDKSDRSCLAIVDARPHAPAVALPGEDALEVAAEHGRQEAGIACEVDAKLVRQRQDELTIGCRGQDAIKSMRGDPAEQKAAKLALHVAGIRRRAVGQGLGQEGLQVLLYDPVQGGVLWLAWAVRG